MNAVSGVCGALTVPLKTNVRSKLSVCGDSNYYGSGLEIYLFGINEDDQLSRWNKVAIYKLYACKITDGNVVECVKYGSPIMPKVTAMGCTASAITAACLAITSEKPLTAAIAATQGV